MQKYMLLVIIVLSMTLAIFLISRVGTGSFQGVDCVFRYERFSTPIGHYIAALFIFISFLFCKTLAVELAGNSGPYKRLQYYLSVIATCAFIAAVSGSSLGTHREDSDPYFGGGVVVVDYYPSEHGRINHAYNVFFILVFPGLYGMHEGIKENKKK